MSLHNFFTLHNVCVMTSTTVIKSYRIGPYVCVYLTNMTLYLWDYT